MMMEIARQGASALLRLLCSIFFLTTMNICFAETYFVATDGDDLYEGTNYEWPLATIAKALQKAMPGDYILIAPGTYWQDFETVRAGKPGKPIRIRGNTHPSMANKYKIIPNVIIKGGGDSRVVQIKHSHIELSDITIDGLHGDPNKKESYRSKLLFVHNSDNIEGLTGINIKRMTLSNAGGECVRFRYFVTNSSVSYSTITNCGVYAFRFNSGGKNGEGIYVGTAYNQRADGKNPTADIDRTVNNRFYNNMINTLGNECIDFKEGAENNLVYGNYCTGNRDMNSAGMNSAGNRNIFKRNIIYGNAGAGIRLGSNYDGFGKDNTVNENSIQANRGAGLKLINPNQTELCANEFSYNHEGDYSTSGSSSIVNGCIITE